MRVDRDDLAGEAAGDDVGEQAGTDRVRAAAGPDHRDRCGQQHVLQAGHVGVALPALDRVQVSGQARVAVTDRERDRDVDGVAARLLADRQPGVAEDVQHRDVLRQRGGGKGADVVLPGDRHEVLEQQGGDSVLAMETVRDRERDLGAVPVVQLVAGHADDVGAQACQQARRGQGQRWRQMG